MNGAVYTSSHGNVGYSSGSITGWSSSDVTSSVYTFTGSYYTVTAVYAGDCKKANSSAQYASKVKTAIYYDDKLVKEDMYSGTYGVAETHDIYL